MPVHTPLPMTCTLLMVLGHAAWSRSPPTTAEWRGLQAAVHRRGGPASGQSSSGFATRRMAVRPELLVGTALVAMTPSWEHLHLARLSPVRSWDGTSSVWDQGAVAVQQVAAVPVLPREGGVVVDPGRIEAFGLGCEVPAGDPHFQLAQHSWVQAVPRCEASNHHALWVTQA